VALAEMIEALRQTARRTITHHQPCCTCVGDDEALFLVLLGACQRGDELLAQTAAQTLSGTAHPNSLLEGAIRFAKAFAARGLMLPYRDLPRGLAVPESIPRLREMSKKPLARRGWKDSSRRHDWRRLSDSGGTAGPERVGSGRAG
jgi:hypothetical protein